MQTQAFAASPTVATFTIVDGLTQTRSRSIGGQSLFLGSTSRSLDGLTRSTTGPSQKSTAVADRPVTTTVTTTVTSHSATGDTETTTYADLLDSITTSYLDGRAKSTTGSAVPDMSYDYATHSENGGEKTITTASGVITSSFNDLLKRPIKTISGATGTTLYAYYPLSAAVGSRGRLQSMTDGDNVTLTYGYNSEGEQTTTSRTVPLASGTATQVTTTACDVVANVVLQGRNFGVSIRQTQTFAATGVPAVTISESFVSRDGLTRGTRSLNGNALSVTTRPDASGIATQTTTNPDGTLSRGTSQHGLMLTAATLKTDNSIITSTSHTYDSLQRPLTSTVARIGTTTYDLRNNATGVLTPDGLADVTESDQPLAMRSPANHTTSITYDIMGRQTSTTLLDNTVTSTVQRQHPGRDHHLRTPRSPTKC